MFSHTFPRNGARVALIALCLGAASIDPAPAKPLFDGVWYVSITTKSGRCEDGNRYPVRIASGVLSNASDWGLIISGKVRENGQITVMVNRGNRSASGYGRLEGKYGAGLWTGESCSGTWWAERRQNGRVVRQ